MDDAIKFFLQNSWQIIGAIGALLAAVFAFIALRQTAQIFKGQQELTEKLHREQMLLTQRQLFIPLYEQFNSISTIDPKTPIWVDVIKAVNFLDLLGTCWEGQLVDETILSRVYRGFVIDTYDRIKQCKNPPPTVEKDGAAMLEDSPAATALRNYLLRQPIVHRPKSIKDI